MVQKRMTRSLILLRSRCTHRGARTHILAIIPEIHRCVLELLSEKSQIVRRWKKGILKSQFSNFMLRVSFPLLLPNMKVYWRSPFRKQSSRIFFSCCFLHLPDFANFSFSTELFWVAKRENRGGKKHDHFLSDAPCKSIVGTSNIFVCQKDH